MDHSAQFIFVVVCRISLSNMLCSSRSISQPTIDVYTYNIGRLVVWVSVSVSVYVCMLGYMDVVCVIGAFSTPHSQRSELYTQRNRLLAFDVIAYCKMWISSSMKHFNFQLYPFGVSFSAQLYITLYVHDISVILVWSVHVSFCRHFSFPVSPLQQTREKRISRDDVRLELESFITIVNMCCFRCGFSDFIEKAKFCTAFVTSEKIRSHSTGAQIFPN